MRGGEEKKEKEENIWRRKMLPLRDNERTSKYKVLESATVYMNNLDDRRKTGSSVFVLVSLSPLKSDDVLFLSPLVTNANQVASNHLHCHHYYHLEHHHLITRPVTNAN